MADEPLIPSSPAARNSFLGGVLLTALGAAMSYFFIYRPLQTLRTTGHMAYYIKGVLIGPVVMYVGVLAFTGKFRDGEIRRLNAKGKPALTRKGWIAVAGAMVVIAVTLAAWFGYLHAIGSVNSSPGE